MARLARVIAVEVAHHVTQRGNARQYILNVDADREVYLSLLGENLERHNASLIGYCLMSNHVHLVMIPRQADALSKSLKHTHGRYSAYWNAKHGSSGHVWQGSITPVHWIGRTCGGRCATRNSTQSGRD